MELVIMANLACRFHRELEPFHCVVLKKRNPLGDTDRNEGTENSPHAEKARTEKWLVRTNRKGQAVDTGVAKGLL